MNDRVKCYDYNFSKGVVNDFERAYPEGYHRCAELFNLDQRSIIWLFQSQQQEWHRFRKISKFLSQNELMLRDLYHRGPHAKEYHHRYGSYNRFVMSMIDKTYLKKDSIYAQKGVDKQIDPYYNIIGHDEKGEVGEQVDTTSQLLLPFEEETR